MLRVKGVDTYDVFELMNESSYCYHAVYPLVIPYSSEVKDIKRPGRSELGYGLELPGAHDRIHVETRGRQLSRGKKATRSCIILWDTS